MVNLKKNADRDRNCLIGQKQFIHTSQTRARIRKLPVHDHITHGQIDSLTGHEEIDNLHFILKIFLLQIYRKFMHFLKTCTVNYKSIAYFLTKFCCNIYF